MANKTNFAKRVTEARAAAKFAKIIKTDALGRPINVIVPGHEAKNYTVIVRRHDNRVYATECLLNTGVTGYIPCPGNSNGHICYHSFAAIIAIAGDAHKSISLHSTEKNAAKKGRPITLTNKVGSDKVWFTVK